MPGAGKAHCFVGKATFFINGPTQPALDLRSVQEQAMEELALGTLATDIEQTLERGIDVNNTQPVIKDCDRRVQKFEAIEHHCQLLAVSRAAATERTLGGRSSAWLHARRRIRLAKVGQLPPQCGDVLLCDTYLILEWLEAIKDTLIVSFIPGADGLLLGKLLPGLGELLVRALQFLLENTAPVAIT